MINKFSINPFLCDLKDILLFINLKYYLKSNSMLLKLLKFVKLQLKIFIKILSYSMLVD